MIESILSLQRNQLGIRLQCDCFVLFDAANKVARHRIGQLRRSNQNVDMFSRLRQKHSGLTGGIAAANNDHLAATTGLSFDESCAVIDARTFKTREVRDRKLAVSSSRGDDNGVRSQRHATLNFYNVWLAPALKTRRTPSDHHLRTKLLCEDDDRSGCDGSSVRAI